MTISYCTLKASLNYSNRNKPYNVQTDIVSIFQRIYHTNIKDSLHRAHSFITSNYRSRPKPDLCLSSNCLYISLHQGC